MKNTIYDYYLNISHVSENYHSISLEESKTIGDLVLDVLKDNELPTGDNLEYDLSMYFHPVMLEMVDGKIQFDYNEGDHIGYVMVPLIEYEKANQSYCISIVNSDLQIINEEINGE